MSKSKRSRVHDNNVTRGKTLYVLSCLPFSFRKRVSVKNFFFDHNVRYGSSVTFRIGVASESLQNLDNHDAQHFDFCIECKPTE